MSGRPSLLQPLGGQNRRTSAPLQLVQRDQSLELVQAPSTGWGAWWSSAAPPAMDKAPSARTNASELPSQTDSVHSEMARLIKRHQNESEEMISDFLDRQRILQEKQTSEHAKLFDNLLGQKASGRRTSARPAGASDVPASQGTFASVSSSFAESETTELSADGTFVHWGEDYNRSAKVRQNFMDAVHSPWSHPGSKHWVHSKGFRWLVSVFILGQTVAFVYHTQELFDEALANGMSDKPKQQTSDTSDWAQIDMVLTGFFVLEIVVRLCVDGRMFFAGSELKWNLFDVFLVALSVLLLADNSERTRAFKILLVLRCLRFLRLLRLMRSFYSFRIMVFSLVHSLPALLWVLLLMLFVLGTFSVMIVHGIIVTIRLDVEDINRDSQEFHKQLVDLEKYYGTIPRAAESLFQAICGGQDWYVLYKPLQEAWWVLGFLFYCYIFFMVFGVLNVVTSIFVDAAYRASQKDPDIAIQSVIEQEREYVHDLRKFFLRADTDGSKMLSFEEFSHCLESSEVQAYFRVLQLDTSQATTLFNLLNKDEDGEISIEEFIQGCQQFRGQAKSLDMAILLQKHAALQEYVEGEFSEVLEALKKDEPLDNSAGPPTNTTKSFKGAKSIRRSNTFHAPTNSRVDSNSRSSSG